RPATVLLYAALAVPALAAALLGGISGRIAPQAAAHLAFATGMLPLILAAQQYFIPVLARCGAPGRAVRLLPALALGAGAGMTAALLWPAALSAAAVYAPAAALAAALGQLGWGVACARRALGAPHPGLAWYLAALACLCAALLAALIMPWWPAARSGLRLLHLHLNLLGFVGLTAIGTVTVLLPTALHRPDAAAARRLRGDLLPALCGVLALAAGSVAWPGLAAAGALALAWPLVNLARAWLAPDRRAGLCANGAAPGLVAGMCGLFGLLLHGIAHGYGAAAGRDAIAAFVPAVLLPLVTGALGELAPVWLRPGPQGAWAGQVRALLARGARLRAAGFLAAAGLLAAGWTDGAWLALALLLQFVLQCLRVAALQKQSRPRGPAG
ncbi:MAG: hypothetical protein JNJ60_18015, partial [Rhodocyclaceae bacterium]|nr:hypothetical protein [Rhodocyclaceae bacterium]